MMNEEIKEQWTDALESGEYEQGYGQLVTGDGKHCCLGVLCELAHKAGVVSKRVDDYGIIVFGEEEMENVLPREVVKWAGLMHENPFIKDAPLSVYNDSSDHYNIAKHSFIEISQLIKENL